MKETHISCLSCALLIRIIIYLYTNGRAKKIIIIDNNSNSRRASERKKCVAHSTGGESIVAFSMYVRELSVSTGTLCSLHLFFFLFLVVVGILKRLDGIE